MTPLAITHLACAAAFTALAGLIGAGKPSNRLGWQAAAACILTAIWAFLVAFAGFGLPGVIPLAEAFRTLSWLVFALSLLLATSNSEWTQVSWWIVAVAVVAVLVLLADGFALLLGRLDVYVALSQVYGRIALAVAGIVLVENVYRNSTENGHWALAPMCVALGGIFGFDLLVYADAIVLGRTEETVMIARGVADCLAVPPLILGMARNPRWRINVHVSRQIVFHTASCVATGAFLLAVALVGTVLRPYAGDWGAVIQLSLLFLAVLIVAMLLTSGTVRSLLKQVIAENFFSHRYDYRTEWLKFIEALSGAESDLEERVVKAIADIVNSPAGALWLLGEGAFRPVGLWNLQLPAGARERADSAFIASFAGDTEVRRLDDTSLAPVPDWMDGSVPLWLAVPLQHKGEMVGFLVLAKSRAPFRLDWEVLQLLGIVARQAASYLSEAQAARALADTKLLSDYSKRFAFVIHDIKNLVSQLNLVLSNAEKFGHEPEFQEDAIHTIRSSVDRLNKLLQQLKSVETSRKAELRADVAQITREVSAPTQTRTRVFSVLPREVPYASIDPAALYSALTHLVNNALEASGESGVVTIKVEDNVDQVLIDVCDQGRGMDPAFIRNELFRPFRTTKSSGYGIGAFQVRELARAAGGDLEVISTPGTGTTMRLILPSAKQPYPDTISAA